MKRLLITGNGYTPDQFKRLTFIGFEIIHRPQIPLGELLLILPTIDVYILGGDERLDANLLEAARRLRLISFVGVGYGAFIDEGAARQRGIEIAYLAGINAPAVAEHTVGLLLGLMRGLFSQNEGVKRLGSWEETTCELSSRTIGIVGMGAIGARLAQILTGAFNCKVVYANRSRKRELEKTMPLEFLELDELFRQSHAIVLQVATTAETKNLVDSKKLSLAAAGLLLINTASPSLVDPIALREALETGQVAAAAFDGYWIEPIPEPSKDPYGLLALPDRRFVITPHTAAKTKDTWLRMTALAVENVISKCSLPTDGAGST